MSSVITFISGSRAQLSRRVNYHQGGKSPTEDLSDPLFLHHTATCMRKADEEKQAWQNKFEFFSNPKDPDIS